jgi:chaperonin GroES
MIKPIGNKLLVKRDVAPTESEGGLLIPDAAQKKETTGIVFAIGSEVTEVQVTDKVVFGKIDGVTIESKYVGESGDFIMLREDQIKATYV